MALSPDARRLAVGDADGCVHLYDLELTRVEGPARVPAGV
jgi:hypothetical protein